MARNIEAWCTDNAKRSCKYCFYFGIHLYQKKKNGSICAVASKKRENGRWQELQRMVDRGHKEEQLPRVKLQQKSRGINGTMSDNDKVLEEGCWSMKIVHRIVQAKLA